MSVQERAYACVHTSNKKKSQTFISEQSYTLTQKHTDTFTTNTHWYQTQTHRYIHTHTKAPTNTYSHSNKQKIQDRRDKSTILLINNTIG